MKTRPICPVCGASALAEKTPFCSARCAERDLARWLVGAYAIPAFDADLSSSDEGDD